MIVDGCSSNDGCKNYKQQKCIDPIDHEKTSHASNLGGKDVIWDDYDVDDRHDFANAFFAF